MVASGHVSMDGRSAHIFDGFWLWDLCSGIINPGFWLLKVRSVWMARIRIFLKDFRGGAEGFVCL